MATAPTGPAKIGYLNVFPKRVNVLSIFHEYILPAFIIARRHASAPFTSWSWDLVATRSSVANQTRFAVRTNKRPAFIQHFLKIHASLPFSKYNSTQAGISLTDST